MLRQLYVAHPVAKVEVVKGWVAGAIEVVEMVGSGGLRWRWQRGRWWAQSRWWRWWEVGDRGGKGVVVDMIKGGGDGGQCGVEVAKGLGQQV